MSPVAKVLDVSQLPSIKAGMPAEEEAKIRKQTCGFIDAAGNVLKLPLPAVATAMVFMHQFYAKHSFQDHDRFKVTIASILLAAKTEESPRKLVHVINECWKLKNRKKPIPLDPKGPEFAKLKESIMSLERVLLHTTAFELSIQHPYMFLVGQIQKVTQGGQLRYVNPPQSKPSPQDDQKMKLELKKYSGIYAKDSLYTSLCLQFSPEVIATACVYLACLTAKVEPVKGTSWQKLLGDNIDMESLASICLQIMDVKSATDEKSKIIRTQLEKHIKNGDDVAGRKSPRPPPGGASPRPRPLGAASPRPPPPGGASPRPPGIPSPAVGGQSPRPPPPGGPPPMKKTKLG